MSIDRTSLGDIARIKKTLSPQGAATWNAILDLLGLPLEMPASEAGPQPGKVEVPSKGEVVRPLPDTDKPPLETKPQTAAPQPVFAPTGAISIKHLGSFVRRPEWSSDGRRLAEYDEVRPAPSVPTLFSPRQERSLITAIALALAETGELDEERVAEQVARGEPLTRIPRRLRPTSHFGVQLLVDRGPRLEPLRDDQRTLRNALLRTVGVHRIQMLRFANFPDRVGPGTPRTWRRYVPPASGTVVLVITDLGLGRLGAMERTHSFDDWTDWAGRVRSAGAHPVALVPHGPRHWPRSLRRHLRLVHWDRTTSVGSVRAATAFKGAPT
ncbi:hypothetical protein [Bradyrhizobium guangdongense]|uniref:Uncharacterized protein n=1 Tax=Bradyrhizobium guangdongense TaxID=1325090 RepID=A0A410V0G6_9BRAD|nr:hypothetical protein [Bradyrhizobium guangdongense]QAU37149.1 hypothetical protein X265_05200 [Bradyrhizobium guangdongense]QOZ58203.1 hypothetical protein XH86_05195 [Bradyrhizobium guangdongense]GGI21023.1 hypothetical protein GCM10010987_12300 [Bradyrhizobium guangdongense]